MIVPLLHAFKLPALKNFQQHILNILNKLILDQLGGAEISQQIKKAACNICTIDSDQLAKLEETLQGNSHDADPSSSLSSPSYRSQGILPSNGSEDFLWKWDALEAYQNFVFEEDRLHSVQIANHICGLIQKGNVVVQWKLYNYIFNPVLQRGVQLAHHCQQLSVTSAQTHVCNLHNQCLPQEVLQIYLKTLPTLLKSRFVCVCVYSYFFFSLFAFECLCIFLGFNFSLTTTKNSHPMSDFFKKTFVCFYWNGCREGDRAISFNFSEER